MKRLWRGVVLTVIAAVVATGVPVGATQCRDRVDEA